MAKLIVDIKRIKRDINGNSRYKVRISLDNVNITSEFLETFHKKKLLKDYHLNITGYESLILAAIRQRAGELYDITETEVRDTVNNETNIRRY